MNFEELLSKVYRESFTDTMLKKPAYFGSRLLDLCQNDYQTRDEVELFVKLDEDIEFFKTLSATNGDSSVLIAKYDPAFDKKYKDCDVNKYTYIVETAKRVYDKKGKYTPPKPIAQSTPTQKGKSSKSTSTAKPNTNTSNRSGTQFGGQTKIAVAPIHKPVKRSSPSKQFSSSPFGGYTNSHTRRIIYGIILGIILLPLLITSIVLGAKHAEWSQWQYVIGIFGSFLLIMIACPICYYLYDNFSIEGVHSSTVTVWIVAVINSVLALLLGSAYRTIFYCVFVVDVLFTVINIFWNLVDGEGVTGFWSVILLLLSFLIIVPEEMLYGAKDLSWNQMQMVIGGAGGTLLLLISIILMVGSVTYFVGSGFHILIYTLLIHVANVVLLFAYQANYLTIFYWIESYLLVGAVLTFGGNLANECLGSISFFSIVKTLATIAFLIAAKYIAAM